MRFFFIKRCVSGVGKAKEEGRVRWVCRGGRRRRGGGGEGEEESRANSICIQNRLPVSCVQTGNFIVKQHGAPPTRTFLLPGQTAVRECSLLCNIQHDPFLARSENVRLVLSCQVLFIC